MKQLLFILFLLLLPLLVQAQDIPTLNTVVTDQASILTPEEEQQIIQLITAIEQATTAELAVLTVQNMEGMSKEEYAAEVFEKNKFGKKDKDNGLLILVALEEREYRVEVGYGLEEYVTDSKKVAIGVKIIEYNFKQGNYGQGIYDAVRAIGELLQGQEDVLSAYGTTTGGIVRGGVMWKIVYTIILILVILSLFGSWGFLFLPVPIGGGRRQGGFYGGNTGGFGSSGFGGGFGGGSFSGGGFGGGW